MFTFKKEQTNQIVNNINDTENWQYIHFLTM